MKIQDRNGDGVALDGIDPVSQFNDNPTRGKTHLSFSIGKMTYYFANEKNLEEFKKNPENYLRGPNELADAKMVGSQKERGIDEEKSRWEETTENIGKESFASGRELQDTPVEHDGMSMKNQKKNKRGN